MAEYVVEEPSDRSASWRVHERIIRCRDCKHFTANEESWVEPPKVPFPIIGATSDSCDFWAGTKCKVTPDGFCKWGERKAADA